MEELKSTEPIVEANAQKKTKSITSDESKGMDKEVLNVEKPTDTDVLCGRGAPINMHPGNVIYRQVVKHNKPLYQTCEKFEKYRVAQSIVEALMGRHPQVRFLEACGSDSDGTRSWKIVPKDKAVKKTIQALRERDRKPAREEAPKRYQNTMPSSEVPYHIPSSNTDHKYSTEPRVEGKEDWQKLFHHLLPEHKTEFKASQSNPSESRLTSGIVIGEGQTKADGRPKTQEKYNKIQHGSRAPASPESPNKSPQSRNKSLHHLMFDGLSVVEQVLPGQFISSQGKASMASSASAATSEMSIEGFKTSSMESPIVTEVSVEDGKSHDDNSYISGYGDAADAYSINSDFGLSPVPNRSVAGDLSEYSVYQTELAECKSKAKGQDQWTYDMDFETIDDQITTSIKSEGK